MTSTQLPVTHQAHEALEVLRATCPDAILGVTEQFGDLAVTLDRSVAVQACTALRDDPRTRFDLFLDLCGVDWYENRDVRFDVVLHLYSISLNHRLRLIFPIGEGEEMSTLIGVWKGTNWFERECWDMYGIVFAGHPWLRRILTHEDFKGHPLRKDYDPTLRHPYSGDADLPQRLFDAELGAGELAPLPDGRMG